MGDRMEVGITGKNEPYERTTTRNPGNVRLPAYLQKSGFQAALCYPFASSPVRNLIKEMDMRKGLVAMVLGTAAIAGAVSSRYWLETIFGKIFPPPTFYVHGRYLYDLKRK